jgi:hypothetical protein
LIEPALNIIAKNRLLEWVLGDDPTRAGTPQIQWTNLPESWGVFVLIGIVGAIAFGVFWLYRREINTCPLPLKMLLGVIRLTVLLLLIAMFLKPSVYYQQVSEIKPTIAMLRDSSMSLDRGDQYRSEDQARQLAEASGLNPDGISAGEITRAQLFNRIFKNDPNLLSQLRDKGAIKISDFADGLESVALIPAERNEDDDLSEADQETDDNQDEGESAQSSLIQQTMPQLVAEGLGTDIWQALKETLDDSSQDGIHRVWSVMDSTMGARTQPSWHAKPNRWGSRFLWLALAIRIRRKTSRSPRFTSGIKAYPDEPFEIDAVLQTSQNGQNRNAAAGPGSIDSAEGGSAIRSVRKSNAHRYPRRSSAGVWRAHPR